MKAQIAWFALAGAVQYGIDVGMFALLYLLGVPLEFVNVIARGTAAGVGYLFNSRITFRQHRQRDGAERRQFIRFLMAWALLTLVSTVLLLSVEIVSERLGTGSAEVVWSKFVVEAFLAVLSFATHSYWIFRARPALTRGHTSM